MNGGIVALGLGGAIGILVGGYLFFAGSNPAPAVAITAFGVILVVLAIKQNSTAKKGDVK
jgi:hypothetical protein